VIGQRIENLLDVFERSLIASLGHEPYDDELEVVKHVADVCLRLRWAAFPEM
jgi:hypothetical protein